MDVIYSSTYVEGKMYFHIDENKMQCPSMISTLIIFSPNAERRENALRKRAKKEK